MSDESTPTSLDAKAAAFLKACEDAAVKQEGIDRAYTRKTLNEFYKDRIVVSGRGPVRVLRPGTLETYETGMDLEDQIAPVLNELVEGCPDEFRLEAVKARQARLAEVEEEKVRSGAYRL
jgi:hypothetical protein